MCKKATQKLSPFKIANICLFFIVSIGVKWHKASSLLNHISNVKTISRL